MSDFTLKVDTKTLKQFITAAQDAFSEDYAVYNVYGKRVVRFQFYEQDRKTVRAIPAGAAYQFSLTQPTDWDLATAPLIRINDDLFTIIDAPNGIIEAQVLTQSSAFNTYIENIIDPSIGGKTGGAMELVEYIVTNSDTDTLDGAINAAVLSFIATDYTKYAIGDKITFLDTVETVIVNAIDSGTGEITFQGAGVAGVSLFSHINGAAIDIKTVSETPLLQYPCTFAGRRDLGGQNICSEGADSPPAYSLVAALLAVKVDKDLTIYTEPAAVLGTDTFYTYVGGTASRTTAAKLAAFAAGNSVDGTFNINSANFNNTTGILTITHTYGLWKPLMIAFWSPADQFVLKPWDNDDVTATSNTLTINLKSYLDDGDIDTNDWTYNAGNVVSVLADNFLVGITADAYRTPLTGIALPFSNAANSPNITPDYDNYAGSRLLLSTSSNEPLKQYDYTVPDITAVKHQMIFEPESGFGWNGETIVWKSEHKTMTNNVAWTDKVAKDIGTFTAPVAITPTGDTVIGSPIIQNVSSITGLVVGMLVSGTGIAAGSAILTIDGATQITLTANATANGVGVTLTCKSVAPQVYEINTSLTTLGLSVGDNVQSVIFIDSSSTYPNDIAFDRYSVWGT